MKPLEATWKLLSVSCCCSVKNIFQLCATLNYIARFNILIFIFTNNNVLKGIHGEKQVPFQDLTARIFSLVMNIDL